MSMISSITDVTEVYSQKAFSEEEHFINNNDSDILKVSKCDNQKETHNQEDEKNIDRNLKKICNATLSNNISDDCGNLQITETSNLTDNYSTGSDVNKKDKLRIDDTSVNEDNDNDIIEKKLSRRFLHLVDSDSEKESNNSKTLNDKYVHKPFKHLQIAKYKKTFKNRSLRKIDSESEDDLQTSNINDFSQTIHKTVSTNVSKYIRFIILSYFKHIILK